MSAISFATFSAMFYLTVMVFSNIFGLLDGIEIWAGMTILDIYCIFMYVDLTKDFILELAYGD